MQPYFDDGQIQIWHARCEDVLPTLEGVDFVCLDPPYGTTQLDWDIPLSWPDIWPLVYAVCKPTAVQAVFSAQPFTTDLITSNRMYYRYELIWPKTMPTGFLDANRRPLRAHETVQVFAKVFGGSTYNPQKVPCSPIQTHRTPYRNRDAAHYGKTEMKINTGLITDRHPTSVLPAFSNGHGSTGEHETGKPLDLVMWLVSTYSNPGDLVLDFCCGNGPVLEACKRLGRRCVGVDVRESCCDAAANRLQQEVFAL